MGFFFNGGFETMFSIIFPLMFIIVFGSIIFFIIRGICEWNRNNHSPKLTVEASIVSKRTNVSHHHNNANHAMHTTTSTSYYVTFQVESGDRMEFTVSGKDYGILAEGDYGTLTFQGTRYLGFDRQRNV